MVHLEYAWLTGTSLKTTGTYTWLAIKPGARASARGRRACQPKNWVEVVVVPAWCLAPTYSLHTEQGVSELHTGFCCFIDLTASVYTSLSGAMTQQITSTYFSCLWVLRAPILSVCITTLFGDHYSYRGKLFLSSSTPSSVVLPQYTPRKIQLGEGARGRKGKSGEGCCQIQPGSLLWRAIISQWFTPFKRSLKNKL